MDTIAHTSRLLERKRECLDVSLELDRSQQAYSAAVGHIESVTSHVFSPTLA